MISRALNRRLFLMAATQDSVATMRMSSLKASKDEKLQYLEPVFESSIKPYLDKSKIQSLEKFCKPVNSQKNTYSFIIDEAVAKDIVEKILSHIDIKKSIIVEGNPGLGILTINLIKSGVPYVRMCDTFLFQDVSLTQMLQQHSDKLTLNNINFNFRPADFLLPLLDEAKNQNQTVTFIGVTTSFYFLRRIIINILEFTLWNSSMEIFIVCNSKVWKSLTNFVPITFKYFFYCGFNLLLVAEKIGSYSSTAFLPLSKTNDGDFHLIKITRNLNVFKHLKEEDLRGYFLFINILGSRRDNLIIPTLEKWVPNCGPYLISKGISMYTKTQNISSQESITLFNFVKQLEGYSDFQACASNAFNS